MTANKKGEHVDTIIIKIKCDPQNKHLTTLRNQGILFDTLRKVLNANEEELDEISFEEYEILEKLDKEGK